MDAIPDSRERLPIRPQKLEPYRRRLTVLALLLQSKAGMSPAIPRSGNPLGAGPRGPDSGGHRFRLLWPGGGLPLLAALHDYPPWCVFSCGSHRHSSGRHPPSPSAPAYSHPRATCRRGERSSAPPPRLRPASHGVCDTGNAGLDSNAGGADSNPGPDCARSSHEAQQCLSRRTSGHDAGAIHSDVSRAHRTNARRLRPAYEDSARRGGAGSHRQNDRPDRHRVRFSQSALPQPNVRPPNGLRSGGVSDEATRPEGEVKGARRRTGVSRLQ